MENTIDTLTIQVGHVESDVEEIKRDVKELDKKVADTYLTIKSFEEQFIPVRNNMDKFLTKEAFELAFKPVKNIIYGMVGAILLAVLSAMLFLVLKGGG